MLIASPNRVNPVNSMAYHCQGRWPRTRVLPAGHVAHGIRDHRAVWYPLAEPHLPGLPPTGEWVEVAGARSCASRQARGVSSWTRFTGWSPRRLRTSVT